MEVCGEAIGVRQVISSANPAVVLGALAKAQAEFPNIPRNGFNPHFKSNFSTLADVKAVCDPILKKHGLSLIQQADGVDDRAAITTILYHLESNEYFGGTTPLSLSKQDPQAHGSALTYMRRYTATTLLGLLCESDDDANEATFTKPAEKPVDFESLKAAAKRAGVTSEQVDEKSREKYKKPLAALSQKQVDELTDGLTELATRQELGAK